MRTSVMPERAQRSSQISSRGRPRIGTRHLGTELVRGRRRVPWPPASRKAFKVWPRARNIWQISDRCRLRKRQERPSRSRMFVTVDERIVHDDLGALAVEGKGHLLHALGLHGGAHCILAGGFGVEQKETTAAGPGNLAAENTVRSRYFVEMVDARARNALGNALLGLPGIVEQVAEVLEVAAQQSLFHQGGCFLYLVQRFHRGSVCDARGFFLVCKYVPGMVSGSRKEQHEI